jgi:hypothetical protein
MLRMKPYSIDDWYECLKLECEIANVPIPPLVRAAYVDTKELIRWFVLNLGKQRLNNDGRKKSSLNRN